MSGVALALVLASAVAHATWNLLAKRAGASGAAFVWLYAVVAAALYAPLALGTLVIVRPDLGLRELAVMAGSAAIHCLYFIVLQRGYAVGDLSLVYPLARGTGPVLAALLAIPLLGERPSPLGLGGALLIGAGVLSLARTRSDGSGGGVAYGLVTGAFIAAYTLWDAYAVARLGIPPLLFDWGNNVGRALLLGPFAAARRGLVADVWRRHRRDVFAVGLLSPLAYILVLSALVIAPVGYVAPAREVSVVIAAALGMRVLGETQGARRMAAAAVVAAGVAALALA